jgi:hypothetical protein
MRSLVVVFAISVAPLVAAPVIQRSQQVTRVAYLAWLRANLGEPAGDRFERALAAALEAGPIALDAFFDAFLTAYAAQAGPAQATAAALGSKALVRYLQERFVRLVGDALTPRTLLAAAQAGPGGFAAGRSGPASPAFSGGLFSPRHYTVEAAPQARLAIPLLLRQLSSEQPLGP